MLIYRINPANLLHSYLLLIIFVYVVNIRIWEKVLKEADKETPARTQFGKGNQPSWIIGGSPASGHNERTHSNRQPGAPDSVPHYVPVANPYMDAQREAATEQASGSISTTQKPPENQKTQGNALQRLIRRVLGR